MKGDFSSRHVVQDRNFSGVLHQQGRVLLDSDWNQQTLITSDWQDVEARDVIGSGVAAVSADDPNAFKVETAQVVGTDVQVTLDPGHAWADGLLVYAEGTAPLTRTARYLQPPIQNPAAGVRDAVVLEVWREAVNAFQQPALLIEPALGGPDTTERAYTAWDVRLLQLVDGDTCENIAGKLADDFSAKGKLSVTLQPTVVIPGDCPVVEGGGYTGFEHNLYRIEIAEVNAGPTQFKWSRFNGGLVGRGVFDAINGRVTITANLQAVVTSGLPSFYLETREFDPALGRWRPTYGATVTLNNNELVLPAGPPALGALPVPKFGAATDVFFVLWDEIRPITDFPVQATPNELIDGIRLAFEAAATGTYVAEDFWTFAVRAGEIPNLQTLINSQPPEGIHYHRVPLAVLEWNAAKNLPAADGDIEDCRRPFQPLTRLGTCCTYRVGDGMVSHGEFTSIQMAIKALPAGGRVCVLPGRFTENVIIENRSDITISGCGERSCVAAPAPIGNAAAGPVFHVKNSRGITIEHLAVEADATGVGVLLEGATPDFPQPAPLRDIGLVDLHITAATRSAIEAHIGQRITIRRCLIEMADASSPWHGIFFIGDDSLIEENEIRVVSRREERIPGFAGPVSAGRGGMQIGGTSERVRVVNNYIHHGIGNGITLGSIVTANIDGNDIGGTPGWVIDPDDPCDPCKPGNVRIPTPGGGARGVRFISAGALEDIVIERNRIQEMGLSGIGVAGFFNLAEADEFITVRRLTIIGNDIRRCLRRDLAVIAASMRDSSGYGAVCLADVEYLVVRDNLVLDNGPDYLQPVCGVYVLHGEGVELSRNRILNNGATTSEPPAGAKAGARGGIYVQFAVAPTVPLEVLDQTMPGENGVPAAVVQNNIVSAPLGRALTIAALGPVSIVANELTTRGMVPVFNPPDTSFFAATVMIVNLGVSAELLGLLALFKAKTKTPNGNVDASGDFIFLPRPGFDDAGIGQLLANGTVLFSDNQVTLELVATGATFTFTSIMIGALDDIGFNSNQCTCNLLDDFVYSQAFLLGLSVRATDNRFTEGLFNAALSAATFGLFMNITAHNQSTHCLLIRPPPPPTIAAPNMVLVGLNNPDACDWTSRIAPAFGK